jgi:hypothetical protein
MIEYTTVASDTDILQILELQKNNLPQNLTQEQKNTQGFVTVIHSFDTLKKMNSIEPSVIAKKDNRVIGYLLAMTKASRNDIPILFPMFNVFDSVIYRDKKISDYKYIVVGQVCIDAVYRGQGILDDCYTVYNDHFKNKYDFAITEIHISNKRSIQAHKRIGFNLIHTYQDPNGDEWEVVLWDWMA